jgi:hypothetical protein
LPVVVVVAGGVAVGVVGVSVSLLVLARFGEAPKAESTVTPVAPPKSPAPPDPPAAPPSAAAASEQPRAPTEVRYPLGALLEIGDKVGTDVSGGVMQALFPSVESRKLAGDLRYEVPLSNQWFGSAELRWKNERDGKLTSVALRPPEGHGKFKNPKEIADCAAKTLGKPLEREVDHLAGDVSYFWGRSFPKAWANLYSSYFWMTFHDPKGVPPLSFVQVLRTLDGCTRTAAPVPG